MVVKVIVKSESPQTKLSGTEIVNATAQRFGNSNEAQETGEMWQPLIDFFDWLLGKAKFFNMATESGSIGPGIRALGALFVASAFLRGAIAST